MRLRGAMAPWGVYADVKPPLIDRVVSGSCRHAWLVALIGLLLAAGSVYYSIHHFALTADTDQLISPNLAWRRTSAAFDKAFPQNSDVTAIVIDGATPEIADAAAAKLSTALAAQRDVFYSVARPDSGPFFQKNGLMLLPLPQVEKTLGQLTQAQAFLGPLAADPSLRGVMSTLSTVLLGVNQGQAKLSDIDAPMKSLTDALGKIEAGKPAFFSWQTLLAGGEKPGPSLTRQFILVKPKLDFTSLEPGAKSGDLIHQIARQQGLDAAHGVEVRLTGGVPLADEQFGSLLDRVWLMVGAMAASILIMLWLAVRSLRIMTCILLVTIIGLIITAAGGLLAVHRFNLISVAFIPLFVGLGVDFGIQFSVRYKAERLMHADLQRALAAAGRGVGGSLALAAAAIAVGFFTFIPTSYSGVSELGVIAGFGMVVAFVLAVTLLPALLTLVRPRGETAEVGFKSLGPLDAYLIDHRRRVLIGSGVAALVCLAALPLLRFDFDPLHMENPHGEAMATVLDLMKDPDETPNTIDVVEPSLAAADAVAARLSALPQVAHALTLSTFVPDQQTEKLAAISNAALLLGPTLDPFLTQPPPTDAEVVQSLQTVALGLRQAAASPASEPGARDDARKLADALQRLAAGPPALRTQAAQTLVTPLGPLFAQIRALLQAGPVTMASLPPDLVRGWVTPDGRARIQVFPKGDSNDNRVLVQFSNAVRKVAPNATGTPITIQEAGGTIVGAFVEAFILSFIATIILLLIVLRRLRDVILTMVPILLTGLLTLATCALIGQPLNYANIIAFPLLFGIGVAFNIYFVIAWRNGETNLLQSSLARAVIFSALTTGASFGSLWLSGHPGTASMGKVLLISLFWVLVTALLFEPALLGPTPAEKTA
jgi:hopanoid biosynthesis associated RND transporter like protein HpnN